MLMVTMSKVLSELLGEDNPLFQVALNDMERASGNPSADVRLSAEIIGKALQKTKELGLDPKDTTGEELYYALIQLVKKHDGFLAKRIGANDPADVQDILPRIKTLLEQLDIPKSAWVMRPSVAKRLLKASPPKKVMRQLGYRSIDSMLKREPIGEIYGAIRFAETAEWQEKFLQKYKKLTPSDFEVRDIEFLQLDAKKWGVTTNAFINHNRHNITHLKELGVILILPLPMKRMPGITITILPLLLHYLNEIRLYSAFFKLQQVKPDFGEIVSETIINDPGDHAVMAGQALHWRVIGRHFGRKGSKDHPEIFEPHVQPEDLTWRKAEEVLYRIEPALHFWFDMDFVAARNPHRPISFNLLDLAVSYVNGLKYGEQAVHHFRQSLWNEIFARYMGQRALEVQILKQLDSNSVGSDFAALSAEGGML